MDKKYLIYGAIGLVVVGGVWFFKKPSGETQTEVVQGAQTPLLLNANGNPITQFPDRKSVV